MIFLSDKGCCEIAGWNMTKDGKCLYIEKPSGRTILASDDPERTKIMFDALCEMAENSNPTMVSLPKLVKTNIHVEEFEEFDPESGQAIIKERQHNLLKSEE